MFDPDKDVTLWTTTLDGKVQVSVCKYRDGPPKLQIGPRVVKNRAGQEAYVRTGRLSKDEVQALADQMDTILKKLG